MRKKIIFKGRDEDGQALVELAFALPLVLLLLFAIIDFGIALNNYNGDTNVANIAARSASVIGSTASLQCNGTSETTLLAYSKCESQLTGGPTITYACLRDTTTDQSFAQGDSLKVLVSSNFSWLGILNSDIGSSNLATTLTGSATMRIEQSGASNAFLTSATDCP